MQIFKIKVVIKMLYMKQLLKHYLL